MSWSKDIIGKSLQDIELEDIKDFFKKNPRESQHLEFKSGDVEIAKLRKEVCALLNGEGGLLILGAPREEPEYVGGLRPSQFTDAGTLHQQLIHGIVPQAEGINILQIPGEGGSVFLIDIPASLRPPHQLQGSGQYYIREGAVSRPALHEEVERMFMEQRRPSLDLKIEIERPDDALLIRLIIGNKSNVSAFEPGFNCLVNPVRFQEDSIYRVQQIAANNYLAEGQQWVQEMEVYPSDTRFFMHCQYYCRDVAPRVKAAFAEIHNNKVELLTIYNSDMHQNYDLWYEENLYLLSD
jgi:hypothetical protein